MKINCYCGEPLEFDIPLSIDLDSTEGVKEAILDGSFLSKSCPACGKIVKPEAPVDFLYSPLKKKLRFVPELERSNFLTAPFSQDITEAVIGYPELIEWIKIYKHSLDRRVLEIIKYYLLKKTEDPEKISVSFEDLEEGSLVFYLYGLKPDEVGVSKIPRTAYEKIQKDLQLLADQTPFCYFLNPPYISVSRISLEKEE